MAATNTEMHLFILLSTRQRNDSLNGSAAAKWPTVITLGLHGLEKMIQMAKVITNILQPCQRTANVQIVTEARLCMILMLFTTCNFHFYNMMEKKIPRR